jgi:hypothetical protein
VVIVINAKTEEDVMKQAGGAYHRVSNTRKLEEIERLQFEAKYNEKAAIRAQAIDIAKRLVAMGIDINVVTEVTKLSVETVLKFCK